MLPQCSKHAPVKGTPPATLTKTLLVGVAEPVCNRIVTPIMQSVAFHTEPWRFPMKNLLNLAATALAAALTMPAQAQTEIQWWHSMGGALGEWVNDMAKDFNASQKDFKVVPTFKGSYDESMTAAIAAFRAGNAPHILQVFEVGTATMMASKNAIVPVGEVMKKAGVTFDPNAYVPAVAGYYTAPNGQMLSFPFNSSTTVFHYNKDAFKAAGLDPNKPPTTWPEVAKAAAMLKIAGHKCPFTTSWVSWTQLESFSAWHNTEFATKGNGMRGTDARLTFNSPLHVRHIENLANMAKNGLFVYKGRGNAADATFVSGECAMITGSSALYGNIKRNAKFASGIGTLPFYPDVPGSPQNTVIGGASLWVMSGKKEADYKGVAQFFAFLSRPEEAAKSHQRTGYLPLTKASYELTEKSGFYKQNPGTDVSVEQMIRKTTDKSRGIRLGNFVQIRTINDEELEQVWAGKKTAKEALDAAVKRGNEQLERFQKANKS
jgi:sn-glycerol 3-phosphate transport system substrate-binding protein